MGWIHYYITSNIAVVSAFQKLARQQKVSSVVSCVCVCMCLGVRACVHSSSSSLTGDEMAEQPYEPGFLRPHPPLYHSEDEAIWLNPTQSQCPIQWDTLMCSHSATGMLFIDTL